MKTDAKLSPIEALKWYDIMDVDFIASTDEDRWKKKATHRHSEESMARNDVARSTPRNDGVSSRALADAASTLEALRAALMSFDGCELKKTATNTVFGDGVPTSKIMLIGEAPGATEDEQGIPFCGESGKLLDNMIAAIGLSRGENVYITNTIFWRPPANRRPTDEEIAICRPFVEKHIALIKPDLLILVGSTAVTSLLGDHLQISKIRQEYYQYKNDYLDKSITTTALFHPAYLMRQPFQKKTSWYDLLKIQEFLGA